MLQSHLDAGALELIRLLGHVPGVEHQDAASGQLAGQKGVVLDIIKEAHNGCTAAVQGIIDEALLPDVNGFS